MYQTKIFAGESFNSNSAADVQFNEWITHNNDINIIDFRYQQSRYENHSIAILYEEGVE